MNGLNNIFKHVWLLGSRDLNLIQEEVMNGIRKNVKFDVGDCVVLDWFLRSKIQQVSRNRLYDMGW